MSPVWFFLDKPIHLMITEPGGGRKKMPRTWLSGALLTSVGSSVSQNGLLFQLAMAPSNKGTARAKVVRTTTSPAKVAKAER